MDDTLVRSKLAQILEELEEEAHAKGGRAYRRLHNGLVVRIEEMEVGFQIAIARECPSLPSETEERTIVRYLEADFTGQWHRFTKRLSIDGRYYNGSILDFHR